ncbi:MAG: glycosyltransferase [Acidimicrobiales bacterium]
MTAAPAAVHQFVPTLSPRDAIGTHTLAAQSVLREMGLESRVYADTIHHELAERAHPFQTHPVGDRGPALLLYQASTGSRVARYLLGRPEAKVVNYHNITPFESVAGWEPGLGVEVAAGRRQLAQLAPFTSHAIADSGYNQAELVGAGYASTSVAPLLIDLEAMGGEAHRATLAYLARLSDQGSSNWLFVGRIVPNKAQHDLVKALAVYRRLYDPRARLHLIGGASSPAYLHVLRRYVAELGLTDAVQMPGPVSHAGLVAYYQGADVFVCASDHEGFCAPLVEAMYHRLPIVAFASSAVPETVGHAGILVPTKDPLTMAAAVAGVVADADLRAGLDRAAEARLAELSPRRTRAAFAHAVSEALTRAEAARGGRGPGLRLSGAA